MNESGTYGIIREQGEFFDVKNLSEEDKKVLEESTKDDKKDHQ